MRLCKNTLFFADRAVADGLAMRRAAALAEGNRARLAVVDVIEAVESTKKVSTHLGGEPTDLLRERRLQMLDALVEPVTQPDAPIHTEVCSCVPFVFFIGNNAEEMLQTTRASVLAVEPAGFDSPVA